LRTMFTTHTTSSQAKLRFLLEESFWWCCSKRTVEPKAGDDEDLRSLEESDRQHRLVTPTAPGDFYK
jgi:hypothetical protein